MNASLQRKEFVSALIDIVSLGISHGCLEDAEMVLASTRGLRPGIRELDTFEAWIAMKRGLWADAIRLLASLDASASNWELGKALLAFCQYASGDSQWQISANEVLENCNNPEALGMVRLLLNPEREMRAAQEESNAAADSMSAPDHDMFMQGAFVRA